MKSYKRIIRQIAKTNNTSEEAVLNEMQNAIDEAYANHNLKKTTILDRIPCKGNRPTVEETINYIVLELQKEHKLMN